MDVSVVCAAFAAASSSAFFANAAFSSSIVTASPSASSVVCRNVVIYFTEEAKDVIYQKFHKALQPGGVLFIGSTEQIMNYRELGFDRHTSFFFEKK